MVRRDELVAEWRARLEECEQALAESGHAPTRVRHWTWLRRMYAQVLRYLISRYGDEVPPGDLRPEPTGETSVAESRSRMPYQELSSIGPGKPPRSGEAIRSVLDSVHDLNPPSLPRGEATEIVVASYSGRGEAKRGLRLLKRHGIASRVKGFFFGTQLLVRRMDYENARMFLEDQGLGDPPRPRRRGVGNGAALGACIGFFAGAVALGWLEANLGERAMVFPAIGTLLGMVCGVLVDIVLSAR